MPQPVHEVVLKIGKDAVKLHLHEAQKSAPVMEVKASAIILMTGEMPTQLKFSPFLGQVIVSSVECKLEQLVCISRLCCTETCVLSTRISNDEILLK